MSVRVLFHFDATPALRDELAPLLTGLDVMWCAESDEERFAALLPNADVLWHVLRPITAGDIARGTSLRLIQKLGAGVNTIDLDAAGARRIPVCNLPGANAPAVAEAALALLLAAMRRLVPLDGATRAGGGWPLDVALAGSVTEVGSRSVGLVGYGAVARRLETALRALGARVLHTSSRPSGSPDWRDLEELFDTCDVISLHLPLTTQTQRLVDAALLARLRPGSILVNTARGGLIDETALYEALTSGRLAAAGLDVFAAEPVEAENPLLQLSNVVFSPHVAWLTAQTMRRCAELAADNCHRLAAGAVLQNVVA